MRHLLNYLLPGCLVAVTVVGQVTNLPPGAEIRIAKPAPSFVLKNLDGQAVNSTNFAGKAWIVLFWASWDVPSQKQVEILNDLQAEYAPAGFTVVALSLDTKWPAAPKAFAATNSVTFPILQADYQTIKHFGGLDAIPTMIVVEPHGNMINRYVGVTSRAILKKELTDIFNMSLK